MRVCPNASFGVHLLTTWHHDARGKFTSAAEDLRPLLKAGMTEAQGIPVKDLPDMAAPPPSPPSPLPSPPTLIRLEP